MDPEIINYCKKKLQLKGFNYVELLNILNQDIVIERYFPNRKADPLREGSDTSNSYVLRLKKQLPHKDIEEIKKLGGKWNPHLNDGPGFIFGLWMGYKLRYYFLFGEINDIEAKKFDKGYVKLLTELKRPLEDVINEFLYKFDFNRIYPKKDVLSKAPLTLPKKEMKVLEKLPMEVSGSELRYRIKAAKQDFNSVVKEVFKVDRYASIRYYYGPEDEILKIYKDLSKDIQQIAPQIGYENKILRQRHSTFVGD